MTDDYPQQVDRVRPQRSVGGVGVRVLDPGPFGSLLLILGALVLGALVVVVVQIQVIRSDVQALAAILAARR